MYTHKGERIVVPKFKTEADLDLARKQAEEKGLPYQTYIKSVLHEALMKRERHPPADRIANR